MALFESDHTKFIRDWLKAHPEEQKEKAAGRALWWDKPDQDLAEEQRKEAARVPTKAYYYDAN